VFDTESSNLVASDVLFHAAGYKKFPDRGGLLKSSDLTSVFP
jgi:hypothetical protein